MKKLLLKIALFVIIDIAIIFALLNIPHDSTENAKKTLYIVNNYNANANIEIKFDDKVYLQKELIKYSSTNLNFANIEFKTCEITYNFDDSDPSIHKFQAKEELKSAYILLTKAKKIVFESI